MRRAITERCPNRGHRSFHVLHVLNAISYVCAYISLPGMYKKGADKIFTSMSELEQQKVTLNRKLLGVLKPDPYAKQILEMTLADAAKGRMSYPRAVSESDVQYFNLSPRFCVNQGTSACVVQHIRPLCVS